MEERRRQRKRQVGKQLLRNSLVNMRCVCVSERARATFTINQPADQTIRKPTGEESLPRQFWWPSCAPTDTTGPSPTTPSSRTLLRGAVTHVREGRHILPGRGKSEFDTMDIERGGGASGQQTFAREGWAVGSCG